MLQGVSEDFRLPQRRYRGVHEVSEAFHSGGLRVFSGGFSVQESFRGIPGGSRSFQRRFRGFIRFQGYSMEFSRLPEALQMFSRNF